MAVRITDLASDDPRARTYMADVVLMLNRGLRRLTVSLDDIRAHSKEMADGILTTPFEWSGAFNEALRKVVEVVGNRSRDEIADTVGLEAFSVFTRHS